MATDLGADVQIDPATNDLVLDGIAEPAWVEGAVCLGQDLRQRIVFSPQFLGAIGENLSSGQVLDLAAAVELAAEEDSRVAPRSAKATVVQADKEGLEIELAVGKLVVKAKVK